uniref:glucuronosyltransferase n=1 Tax=Gopherus agassizii TaxID=38772 RepID=A0A452IMF1_9SAUR
MNHLAYQCHVILNESETLNSLKDEKFDITVVDGFNPCSFLVAEKLGLPFVAVFPGTFANGPQVGIPSTLSYVPREELMSLISAIVQNQVQTKFENVIKEHFPAGSRPVLSELYLEAELWIYNTDFSFEFAHLLLPNTVYIGGLLAKPAKPLSQVSKLLLEDESVPKMSDICMNLSLRF